MKRPKRKPSRLPRRTLYTSEEVRAMLAAELRGQIKGLRMVEKELAPAYRRSRHEVMCFCALCAIRARRRALEAKAKGGR